MTLDLEVKVLTSLASVTESTAKEHNVHILDHEDPDMTMFILPNLVQTWKDLNNTIVEFRSPIRPRARYLTSIIAFRFYGELGEPIRGLLIS